MKAPLDSGRAL